MIELPLQISGTTNRKKSSANRVFADLFFHFKSSPEYNRADRSAKDLKVRIRIIIENLEDNGKLHEEILKLTMCNMISITVGRWLIKCLVGNGSETHVVLFITGIKLKLVILLKSKQIYQIQLFKLAKLSSLTRKNNIVSCFQVVEILTGFCQIYP